MKKAHIIKRIEEVRSYLRQAEKNLERAEIDLHDETETPEVRSTYIQIEAKYAGKALEAAQACLKKL